MMATFFLPVIIAAWHTPPLTPIRQRAPSPLLCDVPGLRQRLREVQVDPSLLAEVSAIVAHKKATTRNKLNSRDEAAAAASRALAPEEYDSRAHADLEHLEATVRQRGMGTVERSNFSRANWRGPEGRWFVPRSPRWSAGGARSARASR